MPLLSIVIPTHRRPRQVASAIASAIDIYADFDIEVLVIPNGQDESWKAVAEQYMHDPRVRWLYLPVGNASAARNLGLSNAQGEYLRFLDDDDYLLPAAADQLRYIVQENLDVCSAPLKNVTSDGRVEEIIALLVTRDFVSAVIHSARLSLTQGSIFRRSFILGVRWREDVNLYDDYFWTLDLVCSREVAWAQITDPVCAYVQHSGFRLSRVRRSGQNSRALVNALLQTHHHLRSQDRLTSARSTAIATALLTHAHSAFPVSPMFLGSVIRQAVAIDPGARPLQPIFEAHHWLATHLLAAEWIMLPPRYLTRAYRRACWFCGALLERLARWTSAASGTSER